MKSKKKPIVKTEIVQEVLKNKRNKHCAITIVSKNYFSLAVTLAESYKANHPGHDFIIVLVDKSDGMIPAKTASGAEVVELDKVSIPGLSHFIYRYTIMELNTAVKPYALHDFLTRYGYETILYIDPDIKIFNPLELVYEKLQEDSIVLIPHMLKPYYSEGHPSDLSILQSGTYNLGFVGLRNTKTAIDFLEWWMSKLFIDCVVDVEKGLFVDQKWVDLAPGFIEKHSIIYHPGYNVAYWNLHERSVAFKNGRWCVNEVPLVFFHFSGFSPFSPHKLSKHQDRHSLSEMPDLRRLTDEYAADLMRNSYESTSSWPYAFETLDNQVKLPLHLVRDVMQWAIRNDIDVPCPLKQSVQFCQFLMSKGRINNNKRLVLLFHFLLERRQDVAAYYPAATANHDDEGFRHWIRNSGANEEGLLDLLPFESPDYRENDLVYDLFNRLRSANRNDVFEHYKNIWVDNRALADFCVWIQSYGATELKLTQAHALSLLAAIGGVFRILNLYFLRGDLQVAFRQLSSELDRIRFVEWMRSSRRETGLSHEEISLFAEFASASGLLIEKMRFLYQHFGSVNKPSVSIYNVDARRYFVSSNFDTATAIDWLVDEENCSPYSHFFAAETKSVADLSVYEKCLVPGLAAKQNFKFIKRLNAEVKNAIENTLINVAGYFSAPSGMGESARSMLAIARAVEGVETGAFSLADPRAVHTELPKNPFIFGWPKSNAKCSIVVANADSVEDARVMLPNSYWAKKNVGFWVWETNVLPEKYRSKAEYFDEIWTPSRYSADAIAKTTGRNVRVLPHSIDFPLMDSVKANKERFGINPSVTTFGFVFDPQSVIERKNVAGLIRAFELAFGEDSHVELIIKINSSVRPNYELQMIMARTKSRNIRFVTSTLSRGDALSFIKSLDVYVSLHRSEGFGLTCAEAMALSVPVVATRYSGNLEFMNDENSILVTSKEVQTDRPFGAYPAGTVWAEPDLEMAASIFRRLTDKKLRIDISAKGRASVKKELASAVLSKKLQQLLNELI